MKENKNYLWSLLLLVLVAALYRIVPGRPVGFAPQWAMAVFAGAVIKDRTWAFLFPVISMFLSDLLFQVLYLRGVSAYPGFYEGQWQNYALFALLVVTGFMIKRLNVYQIVLASFASTTLYFLLSNFIVWAGWSGTRGWNRPKTWDGLLFCYQDGIPFYKTSLEATAVFSIVLFGSYYLIQRRKVGLAKA